MNRHDRFFCEIRQSSNRLMGITPYSPKPIGYFNRITFTKRIKKAAALYFNTAYSWRLSWQMAAV